VFEPSSVEADTTVTVTLTLELAAGTNEVTVPVPDAFSIFGCTAPAGWLCWTTDLGQTPASMTVARNGGEGSTVAVQMELRTPTASGDYAFGDAVLVVTGGFEGGPSTSATTAPAATEGTPVAEAPGDDPVMGAEDDQAIGEIVVDEAPPGGDRSDEVVPAVAAALLIAAVLVRLLRGAAARR